MKKNQKILAAILAIVIVLAVVIFAIAMNKNTNEETSNSNVETSEVVEESTKVESSTEVLASIGTAPEDSTSFIDKSDAINFPGSETSESSTSESSTESSNTESSTSESTTESTTSSASKTETSASSTSESSTSESTTSETSTTETSTSKTSTSAEPTTSSTTPSTPVDNSSSTPAPGEQITQGSTGTTSLGTTYPIVSEFNKLGLDSNSNGWASSDGMASSFSEAFGQANRAISDVLGYPSTQIAINVTNTYISYGDAYITRNPEKGYYTFSYTYDLREESDGGASSRAVHTVMLAAITSNPVEVENAMYNDCFVNPTMDGWVTIGDCQVRFSYADDTCTVYKIKPLN